MMNKLNSGEAQGLIGRATKYRTESNRHKLHCPGCGALYYVDEQTLQKVTRAMEGDPAEITFYCEDCEQGYAEEKYAH
jgi:DNA replicative helicase MCM subunit Mcm2 (Cdc46/Mcm family)